MADVADLRSDGPPSAEVNLQEKEISRNANEAFEAGQYDSCLTYLAQLQELRKDDAKVMLNKAVAEFYKSGQTATDEFRHALTTIKSQVHSNMEDVDGLDDVENGTTLYNQAVVLYHLKQYVEAIALMERLYQVIEPFDEKFARAVCCLLVDLYLLTYQAEKALPLLAVLEKMLAQGAGNTNGKSAEPSNNNNNKDGASHKVDGSGIELARSKLHQYKVRSYLQMKSLKACKREIKSVMNTSGNSISSLFLKSNFEFQRGNYRKAVKLLNSANIADHPGFMKTGECVPCMFWNNLGCVHHAMGKLHMSSFYFRRALQENDYATNQLAAQIEQDEKLPGRPLCTLLADCHYEVLHNCGVLLLQTGRPLVAFECLVEAVQVYHSNPRLWLRLAECCIAAGPRNDDNSSNMDREKKVVKSIVGRGLHRKLILASHVTNNIKSNSDAQSSAIPVASLEFAGLCLRNSLLLLPETPAESTSVTADTPYSLGTASNTSIDGTEVACKGQNTELSIPAFPSSPLRRQEVESLRCSALACSAYVALGLGDSLLALQYAEKLLQQPKLSGSLRFLGHLYAAEALIAMDRISDAIRNLNPENITDVSLVACPSEPDQGSDKSEMESLENNGKHAPQSYPSSVTAARAIMLFNLGTAYCLRTEFEKARTCLQQACTMVLPTDVPPEAILLAVYLELQSGNPQQALQIIKRNQLMPPPIKVQELRKKPLAHFQPSQTNVPFTTLQRK
uniref:CCR4-NOT transcription complex subunit 10 isoform X2 n=1 Tax=Myxine glutinosa TaxID=7769 RepID=UPI00358FC8C4